MATYEERIAPLLDGTATNLVLRTKAGFVTMADTQFLPGYCILLAYPRVTHLTDLDPEARKQYLFEMSAVGQALIEELGAVRANYSILANLDTYLHAHIWPRYANEPAELATAPPLMYPESVRNDPANSFDPARHGELMRRLKNKLRVLLYL